MIHLDHRWRVVVLALAVSALLAETLVSAPIPQQTGDEDASIARLRAALELEPDNAQLHQDLALLLLRQDKQEEALEQLQTAVRLEPKAAERWARLAQVLLRVDRLDEAIEAYTMAAELDPDQPQWRLQRAAALVRAGRQDEAIAEINELLAKHPDSVEALFGLGMALAAAGETDEAVAQLHRILELDSTPATQASVHSSLGLILADAGRTDDAIIELRLALTLDAELVAARGRLANLLADQGRFDEAAREFATLARMRPDNPEVRFGEAVSLLLAERYPDALTTLEEATARFPQGLGFRNALARLLATCPVDEVRDGERALALAKEVVQTRPELDYFETVAMALAELGRFDEAVEVQSRLIEQAKNSGQEGLVRGLEARLQLYQAGEPCRAPWLATR